MSAAAPELVTFGWARMPAMADLWVEAWQETIPEIDFEARRGWLCHRIGALVEEGTVIWVAVLRATGEGAPERVLGFVTIQPLSGYVDQLVVHPDHWGSGIARRLILAAAEQTRQPLVLDVNEENERAVRFYEKAGFTVAGHGVNSTSGRPTLRMMRAAG